MPRRLFVALSFVAALALGAVSATTPAAAQSGPICSKFDSGLEGWGPCSWAPNVTTTTTATGGIGKDDSYLQVTDLSGASAVCSSNPKYLGNWVEKMGGCGQLCFDFKVFSSGIPPSAVTPSFSIYSGTNRATFYANFQVAIGDTSWHRNICAPIMLGASAPPSPNGHWVIAGGTWNSIITNVTMMSLPIDFSSSPSEVVGYDNICMSPGGCGEIKKPEITGCLKDSKIEAKCNPDGTYTVTLTSAGLAGDSISLVSMTPGVSVAPPQQPWAATTTWTLSGATPGQLVTLNANVSKVGGGSQPGIDQCCSGEIKIVMPECPKPPIDLKVEKENTPSGGQGNGFNVWVTNVGAPITFAPGELTVDDYVPAGLNIFTQTSPNWTCIPVPATGPATIHCTYNLAGTLGTGGQLTDSIVFTGVLTNHEKPQENCAVVSIPATVGVDANPSNDKACVTIKDVKAGELIFTKHVVYKGPILLPPQNYPVTVTCGSNTTTLNLADNVPQSIGGLPYTTNCSYVEPTPPVPPGVCPPSKNGVWATVFAPPSPVIISVPVTNVSVTNTLTCEPKESGVDVGIKKTGATTPVQQPYYVFDLTVTNVGAAIGNAGAIVVTETVPANMTFNTVGGSGWTCVPPGGAAGTAISCTYSLAATAGQVLPGIHIDATATGAAPYPPVTNCAQVGLTTASGLSDTNPANNNSCVTVTKPRSCPPPQILNVDGICAAPPPTCVAPMVPAPVSGQCACPQGTVQRGRRCVSPIECRPPQIPNAAGTSCICPDGLVQRGRLCVQRAVCNPPAKLNRRGACECPRDMVAKGNTCVGREHQRQDSTPGDIMRMIPGRGDRDNRGGSDRGNEGSGGLPGRR